MGWKDDADDAFDDKTNPYAAPETDEMLDEDEYEGDYQYGTFWARLVAVIVDGFLTNLIAAGVGFLMGIVMVGVNIDPTLPGLQAVLNLVGIVISWMYEAGFTSSSAMATPGKQMMGLKVTTLDGKRIGFGRASGRFFAKILSAIVLLIGYLMQPFTERKQALHDILAGTLVLRR